MLLARIQKRQLFTVHQVCGRTWSAALQPLILKKCNTFMLFFGSSLYNNRRLCAIQRHRRVSHRHENVKGSHGSITTEKT